MGKKLRRLADRGSGEGGARRFGEDAAEGAFSMSVDGCFSTLGGDTLVEKPGAGRGPKVPVVEKRISICGDKMKCSEPDADGAGYPDDCPADVCGRVMCLRPEGEVVDGESGFILLIDIFFKKPQRPVFSLLSFEDGWRDTCLSSENSRRCC